MQDTFHWEKMSEILFYFHVQPHPEQGMMGYDRRVVCTLPSSCVCPWGEGRVSVFSDARGFATGLHHSPLCTIAVD